LKRNSKAIQVRDSKLARILDVNAIVLYPFIFFAEKNPDAFLINHEFIHVDQIRRHGIGKFYFLYLYEYLQHRLKKKNHFEAYMAISFEKEAYTHQNNLAYLEQKA
jgi:hypothetical protein